MQIQYKLRCKLFQRSVFSACEVKLLSVGYNMGPDLQTRCACGGCKNPWFVAIKSFSSNLRRLVEGLEFDIYIVT